MQGLDDVDELGKGGGQGQVVLGQYGLVVVEPRHQRLVRHAVLDIGFLVAREHAGREIVDDAQAGQYRGQVEEVAVLGHWPRQGVVDPEDVRQRMRLCRDLHVLFVGGDDLALDRDLDIWVLLHKGLDNVVSGVAAAPGRDSPAGGVHWCLVLMASVLVHLG